VSTPTMMSVGIAPLMLPALRSGRGSGDPAGGQDRDGTDGLRLG
jgi:hypothetical protein